MNQFYLSFHPLKYIEIIGTITDSYRIKAMFLFVTVQFGQIGIRKMFSIKK